MKSKFLIISLVIVFANIQLYSLERKTFFTNYTIRDGLSDNIIHCIFQDSKGWIWVGTSFGVLRFDGYEFRKLDLKSEASDILGKSLIRIIYEDLQGNIWIGTEYQGLFKYNRNQYELLQIKGNGKTDQLSNNSVWAIVQDAQGMIWFGTEDGLNRYNPLKNTFNKFSFSADHENSLPDSFIRSLMLDNSENLWVGTNNGIAMKPAEEDRFIRYFLGPKLNEYDNEVYRLFEDNFGQIWAGTYFNGLKLLNKTTDKFENYDLGFEGERTSTVRTIAEDKDKILWIGSRGGLFRIDQKSNTKKRFIHDEMDETSILHNSIMTLLVDKKGDLWVGSRGGISFLNFDKQSFGNISIGNEPGKSLNNGEIYAFWEDDNKNLWIGTESGGIGIYNKQKLDIKHITKNDGLSNNCIKAMYPDNNGNLLIGTYLGGLNILNLKTGRIQNYKHLSNDSLSLSDDAVWSIFKDSRNRIWVGTSAGIDLFEPHSGKFIHYGFKWNVNLVVLIFEDSKGRLWIGSENKKITMVDSKDKKSDYLFKVRSICEDNDGTIWLGTVGNGLVSFNPETDSIKEYTVKEGLCNNIIYGIEYVDNKYLWLSTLNGLSRFDLNSKVFRNFYQSDGLLNNQFNYGAYYQGSDNVLYFGGGKGVDMIFYKEMKENDFIPNIVFTDFLLFNKSVVIEPDNNKAILHNYITETEQITLPYDQNMITFEFAALNYANSSKNQYAYKLEGFDRDWNLIGTQRRATYTNLDHGRYTLRVKESKNDNLFNESGTTLKIIILPPFWKTWWFRFITLLSLGIIGYVVFRYISNREKLKNQLVFERQSARKIHELDMFKHQFFMNISHEIRTPLSLIIGPLDQLINSGRNEELQLKHLEIIKRNTVNLSKLVNQLLDYRKLETGNVRLELKRGDMVSFLKNIFDTFKDLATERKIDLQFRTIQKEIISYFDADKLEKIINNLLSNALKYTPENGKVSLNISLILSEEIERDGNSSVAAERDENYIEQYIQIVVKDTGIGIPASHLNKIFNRFIQVKNNENDKVSGTGIGLSLAKDLIKLHHGYINVKSTESKGSRFIIHIPFYESDPQNETIQLQPENAETDSEVMKNVISENTLKIPDSNQPILLIIDDNADIREFIRYHFAPEYIVVDGRNGKEGWDKTLEIIPDIIIADVMMPEMDGKELCRRIKKDERTSHIPVLMLTALSSRENQISGIDAGADDYITKPFDISLLKAKVDNLFFIRKNLRERFSKEMILRPKEIILSSPDEKFLKKLIAHIEKNMDNPELDVDQLSLQLAVSRTQLYRKIAALTDMSVKEFVRDMRLQRASQLIVQNKLTINEVAIQTGFNDISYFRKCFREKFGMNASEYSRSNSENTE